MPGVRAVTYFLAGAAGMRYLVFIGFDGLAATVSAPVFVLLGWHFGDNIERLVHAVRKGQTTALLAVAAVVLVVWGARALRRRLAATAAEKARAEEVVKALPSEVVPAPEAMVPPPPAKTEARLAK